MTVPEIVAMMTGTAVLLVSFAVFQIIQQSALNTRLRVFVRRDVAAGPAAVRRPTTASRVAFIESFNRRLRRASFTRRLQRDLVRAGIKMPASRFAMIQVIVGAIGFLVVWMMVGAIPDFTGIAALVVAAVAGAVGWYVPMLIVGFMESRRVKKFEQQLPPTIDAMAGALQAGSSLPQAMEMVSREVAPPIAEEFAIVIREMSVGVPMQDAFANLVERVRSLDLDMLVTAITIQHRVGGNLSQILRTISHTVRERLRIRGEISVLTAQQRLSGIIVSALPIVVIAALFLLAPDYIKKLFEPGIARIMLVMGAMGIVAGFYALRRIADIEV